MNNTLSEHQRAIMNLLEDIEKLEQEVKELKKEQGKTKFKEGEEVYYINFCSNNNYTTYNYRDTMFFKRMEDKGLLFNDKSKVIEVTTRMLEIAKEANNEY